ncbi:MAG TPA: FRG domain-containing protein [Burkholderiales bacterium]|nr:FRG domain-containing protein [Burkholderiales bacterium]
MTRPAGSSEITEIRLQTGEDLHRYAKAGWLYRGHRKADWEIESSIERCFAREGIPVRERYSLEQELLRDFKRAYHQYAAHVPGDEALLEWLALMEHHGAPTRCVDFSYSIYVAAYFALEDADADCAVWAINGPWASKASVSALRKAGKKGVATFLKPTVPEQEAIANEAFLRTPHVRCAVPLNPFRLNERLRTQKGIFMVPGDCRLPFMDNLRALPRYGSAENVVKLVIPIESRRTILRQLYHMNVSRTSLFPGLDGYAKSLGVYHPSFEAVKW